MDFGHNVKARREAIGMTQDELAEVCGYKSRSSINKIELNKNDVTQTTLAKLSKALNTTPDELLGYREKEKRQNQIPLLGTIAAGLPMFAEQNIEEYLTCDMKMSGEFFALRVKGDSMNAARINPGDIVIIRIQPVVENGEIAAVRVDGDNATLKRFYQDGQQITLMPQSLNPAHQIQTYDTEKTDIEIYGKAMKGIFIVK